MPAQPPELGGQGVSQLRQPTNTRSHFKGGSRPRTRDSGGFSGYNLSAGREIYQDPGGGDFDALAQNIGDVSTHEVAHDILEPEISPWAKTQVPTPNAPKIEQTGNPFSSDKTEEWNKYLQELDVAERKQRRIYSNAQEAGAYNLTNPDWGPDVLPANPETGEEGYSELIPAGTQIEQRFNAQQNDPWMQKAFDFLKRQTELGEYHEDFPSEFGESVQWSAQPLEHHDDYSEGRFPEDFWSLVSNNPDDVASWGKSKNRSDDQGKYLAVGIRAPKAIGELPTRGPARPRKGRAGYPQDYGVRVVSREKMQELDPRQIILKPSVVSEGQ
jgi:hypothetical protein